MYLMQTVSTVPRARPLPAQTALPAPRSRSMDRGPDASPACAPAQQPGQQAQTQPLALQPAQRRRSTAAQEQDGEKKKKWSLGGLFRRRRKQSAEERAGSESSSEEEASRGGFLSRRRSRREKRKPRPRQVGTFDHVVVSPTSPSLLRPRRDADPSPPPPPPPVPQTPVRPRDTSASRYSSGSLDSVGRRSGRRGQTMARAEALREQQRGSSSDECGGFSQSPGPSRPEDSPSSSRRSRSARTRRYARRLSREEEGGEVRRQLPQEAYDTDRSTFARTPSATPSPKQSPVVRPRHPRHRSPPVSDVPDQHAGFSRRPYGSPPAARAGFAFRAPQRGASPAPSPAPSPSPHSLVRVRPENSGPRPFPAWEPERKNTGSLFGPTTVADDDVLVVQFPIARPGYLKPAPPPPPPPRDPQRRLGPPPSDPQRPMSYAFEAGSPQAARIEYCLNRPSVERSVGVGLRTPGPPQTVAPTWPATQRRSVSENQLAAAAQLASKCARPRPASVAPPAPEPFFQYVADRQPRSRRPIHVHARAVSGSASDQPYLSDSQAVSRPPFQRTPAFCASDSWRHRDGEPSARRAAGSAPPKPPAQWGERSRSVSPRPIDTAAAARVLKPRIAVARPPENDAHARVPFSEGHDAGQRPLPIVTENEIPTDAKPIPPAPPVRRYSRQSSVSSLEAGEDTEFLKAKRRSTDLEDALNELEAIYKSLRLGDEDLLERAERREAPAYRPPPPPGSDAATAASRRPGRGGAESDSGYGYGYGADAPGRRDRFSDDMAYRRLHPKERPGSQDARAVVSRSGSYLLASPALARPEATSPGSTPDEPDRTTHDDVLFRSIKHANNTLRVLDPQPPFGIPLGPVPPASNSDYLHATPVDRPRSAFKPCRVPDVVKDDLAFRNLRKDNQKESCLPPARPEGPEALFPSRADNANFCLRKKRAVRSLSANLMGLVHGTPAPAAFFPPPPAARELEKAQSLSDLPDALQVAQKILEGKEVIGGGAWARRGADEALDPHYGVAGASWVERAQLDSSLCAGASTSTETLTEARADPCRRGARRPPTPKSAATATATPTVTATTATTARSPPPAPVSTPVPAPALNESRLDELLSALAREADVKRASPEEWRREPPSTPVEAAPPPTPPAPPPPSAPPPDEDTPRRHESVDELVTQCRRDLDELLRQVDAATRQAAATAAAAAATTTVSGVVSSPSSSAAPEGSGWGQEGVATRTCGSRPEQGASPTAERAAARRAGGVSGVAGVSASAASGASPVHSVPVPSPGARREDAEARMARYKEERRRQLASQFGPRDGSSSDAGPRRYISRHRGSASDTAGPAHALVSSSSSSSSSSPSPTANSAAGGPLRVRTTRASRLRVAVSAASDGAGSKDGGVRARRVSGAGSIGSSRLVATSATTGSSDKEKSPLASSVSASLSVEGAAPRREKDKSSRRKSNLNRSLVAEEVPDLTDDGSNRRRRRRPDHQHSPSPFPAVASSSAADSSSGAAPDRVPEKPSHTKAVSASVSTSVSRASSVIPTLDSTVTAGTVPGESQDAKRRPSGSAPTPTAPTPAPEVAADAPTPSSSPSRQPFSILKKKSLEEVCPAVHPPSQPVSILKRKTLQDDLAAPAPHPPPPVTFSPSVRERTGRRQGILKKRCSLDEAEVLRQRSCSPDAGPEFRPILKQQQQQHEYRRSSLEELVRRARSPDGLPHSILKRRASREEQEPEDRGGGSPEPQGILKRKSSVGAPPPPLAHVSIAAAVVKAVAAAEGDLFLENGDHVRPILKKKSSSEDNTADSSSTEAPRPILKKKASVEVDDEDRPKKPILKSASRKQSRDESVPWETSERDATARCLRRHGRSSDSASGSDADVRPILKNSVADGPRSRERSASPRARFASAEDVAAAAAAAVVVPATRLQEDVVVVVLRSRSASACASASATDSEAADATERARLCRSPVGVSVAERVHDMESFLGGEKGRGGDEAARKAGAKRASRDKGRFRTQPITQGELRASVRFNQFCSPVEVEINQKIEVNGCNNQLCDTENLQRINSSPPLETLKTEDTSQSIDLSESTEPCSSSMSSHNSILTQHSETSGQSLEDVKPHSAKKSGSAVNRYRSRKSASSPSRFATQPVTTEEVQEAWRQTEQGQHDHDGNAQSSVNEVHDEDEPSKLSLADRVRLFNQKIKDVEVVKPVETRVPPTRRRMARFKTGPVTTEEVESAQLTSSITGGLNKSSEPHILGKPSQHIRKYSDSEQRNNLQNQNAISFAQMLTSALEQRPKGILKQSREADSLRRPAEKEPDESDGDLRSILKGGGVPLPGLAPSDADAAATAAASSSDLGGVRSPPLEGFRRLRSALKKESATAAASGAGSSDSESEEEQGQATDRARDRGCGSATASSGGLDIVSILHNVEEDARRQREALAGLGASGGTSAVASGGVESSDGDTSSSGGREVKRIIRNEAVARRRNNALARQCHPLAKSQSLSEVQALALALGAEEGGGGGGGLQRSNTQPMAAEVERDAAVGASIADRLAALQKNGSSEWRRRLPFLNPERDLLESSRNLSVRAPSPSPQRGNRDASPGATPLAERLGKLDAAAQGWRKRVGPSDAVQFSVAGRMQLGADSEAPLSPLVARLASDGGADRHKKRKPRALRFRGKAAELKEVQSTPSSPQKDSIVTLKRSASAPEGNDESQSCESPIKAKVAVPRPDDETFMQFFSSVSTDKLHREGLKIKDDDLDVVTSHLSTLLISKRTVKIQRRKFTSRNPIRSLQARTDIQEEYEEVKLGVAEKELRRLRVEQLAKHSAMAVEALAGLASKEDFTAITLKKTAASSSSMLTNHNLLLMIKGRRHVQTRLVEPVASSINSGDNYVLVTPNEVFNWVGQYSNVIECSRGAEVAQHIVLHKDLGFSGSSQVITVSENKVTCSCSQEERFWQLLGADGKPTPSGAGHPDEDELYETSIIATNMIYEVKGDVLDPLEECWGTIPSISILDPSKTLVFDFGTELYVWNGKNATMEARRQAQNLAQELWDQGYDYSDCDICPLSVAASLGLRKTETTDQMPSNSSVRPPWAKLSRVTQHMETILFREKFLDWPDFSRIISVKETEDNKKAGSKMDIKPYDAKEMLIPNEDEPDLVLENMHLGRGHHFYDKEKLQEYIISTLGVTVWHILEYESAKLPETSVGQFHTGDSYVVQWQYSITVTGRTLSSGEPSRHSIAGRDRCSYFFWQGEKASVNEQGAAALLTVELDREHGPQVRVVQGSEPPAFLRLFQGRFVVHAGRREGNRTPQINHWEQDSGTWKLFVCRGEKEEEAVLVQLTPSMRHLRSRAAFLLLNTSTGSLHVWYGAKACQHTQKIALKTAQNLKENIPPEFGFKSGVSITIHEEKEGYESKEFLKGVGGNNRELYVSLGGNSRQYLHTPRLFHLSSVSGSFTFSEMLGPYRHPGQVTAYPFLQNDLYSASQPALFLLDNKSELWLWQGWWPNDVEDSLTENSDLRGSRAVQWQAERRAAMQIALDYWQLIHPDNKNNVPAYLVWAGLEPLTFTNLFPSWTDCDDIAEMNIKDGRKPNEVLEVGIELARLTRSTFPPAQLLQRPLPDGVDPTRLELYLEPHHFKALLNMTKEEFMDLPSWKQTKVKKEVGLF